MTNLEILGLSIGAFVATNIDDLTPWKEMRIKQKQSHEIEEVTILPLMS